MATKKKVTDLISIDTVNENDLIHIVDVSDTSQDINGSSKKTTIGKIIELIKVAVNLADLGDDSTHRLVTDTEKTNWNNKSDFSGSYDDLTEKPTIPTSLADLSSDSTHRTVTDAEKTNWNGKEDSSNKGQNNGYAELDAGGKIPLSRLPSTLLVYKGVWNATTNNPTLTSTDLTKKGWVYNVAVAGTQFGISFKLGDWFIYNDSGVAEKSDNSDDVTSVNGQQGAVVLDTDSVSEGGSNLYFTVQRAKDAITQAFIKLTLGVVSSLADGYLTKEDFAIFNNKVSVANVQNFELYLASKMDLNCYMEYTTVSGNITAIDYWTNSGKTVKLFTKTITYSSNNPTVIAIKDETTNKTLTTTIAYTTGVITSITKVIS